MKWLENMYKDSCPIEDNKPEKNTTSDIDIEAVAKKVVEILSNNKGGENDVNETAETAETAGTAEAEND